MPILVGSDSGRETSAAVSEARDKDANFDGLVKFLDKTGFQFCYKYVEEV